jgi:hypothetical protein
MAKDLTVKELAAMGGKARAKKLGKARRKEIASEAAKARWGEKKAGTGDAGKAGK